MEFRKEFYKYTKVSTVEERRARRSEWLGNARAEGRMKLLQNRRETEIDLAVSPPPAPSPPKKKTRAEMLQEWKIQKLKRMEEMKKKHKPIFKVGVVKRKANGSPMITKPETKQSGMVTRAKAKLLVPAAPPKAAPSQLLREVKNKLMPIKKHNFVPPKSVAALGPLTIPISPQITKSVRKARKVESESESTKMTGVRFDFDIPQSSSKKKPMKTPVRPVVQSNQKEEKESSRRKMTRSNCNVIELNQKEEKESSRRKCTRSNCSVIELDEKEEMEVSSTSDGMMELQDKMKNVKIPNQSETKVSSIDYVPIHYSPYVTMTRGSAKKSPKPSKISLSMDVNEQIQKEEKEFTCRIFSFRKFVDCETNRLLGKCSEWEKFTTDGNLPEDVLGEINSVIGKTKLLTSDKFKQFSDLIEKCDQKDPMIKVDDLQGFQDWVSIEVDKIDDAFNKLEEGKKNNFAKKEIKFKTVKSGVNKENKIPAKQPVGKSNIRAHIMAARAKLMRQNATDLSPLQTLPTWAEALSPTKKTPVRNESLMKSVLTSETKKKFGSPSISGRPSSGLEIFTVAQIAKNLSPGKPSKPNLPTPTSSADTTLTNLKLSTPGKGILKSTPFKTEVSKKFTISSPKRSVIFKFSSSPKSLTKKSPNVINRLSDRYFAPPEETDESTDDDSFIKLMDGTPAKSKLFQPELSSSKPRGNRIVATTPLRKSARLANK